MEYTNTQYTRNPDTGVYTYAAGSGYAETEKIALWFLGRAMPYSELFSHIDNAANHLYHLGVREGSVVTLHMPNCPQAVIAFYAVAKLGGICSMVHALTPPAALQDNMLFSDSSFLITYRPDCVFDNQQTLLADISHFMGSGTKLLYRLKTRIDRASAPAFEDLLVPNSVKATYPSPDNLAQKCAVYLHSSGSTGKPKTICLSHSALNHCVDNTADFFEKGDMAQQISIGVLPWFHGFGLAMDVHRNISFGSQLILLPRWNVKNAVKLIKKRGVTLMVGVPAMYHAMLKEPTFNGKRISQLTRCFVGGDNVSPELIAQFDARLGGGHRMLPGFGLTEATTTNCVNNHQYYKIQSCGYPVRNTTIAVMDEHGNMCKSGAGELVISSKTLMMGYLKDEPATQATMFSRDGKRWVRTGDMVYIDEDGFLFFQRRIKHIIIRNGYNIYPDQIEDAIRSVDSVANVCVVGVDDEENHTQIVRAVVILKPGTDQKQEETAIRARCLQLLPRYAVPGQIKFMSAFPQNAMGKTDRKELGKP